MDNQNCRALNTTKWLLVSLVFCALMVLALPEARADHSLGNSCIGCHSLRSGKIEPGSRNVLQTEVSDFLYQTDWYCSSNKWDPIAGEPLDCSFCHKSDMAVEFQAAIGGKFNTSGGVGSAHPVDVGADSFDSKLPSGGNPPNPDFPSWPRIKCNDCHNGSGGELTPLSPCSKNSEDGYPNHKGTVVPNDITKPWTSLSANNLAFNPPRLTDPYGTDVNWATATFQFDDVLCFRCHDNNNSTQPPFTSLDETSMTNIMSEYNASHGGHGVSGTGNGTEKVACYHCHDPHSAADDGASNAHNEALINNAAAKGMVIPYPYDPNPTSPVSTFNYSGYVRGNETAERSFCLECHGNSSARVGSSTPIAQLEDQISPSNLTFGFHADVHSTAATSGGCLQSTTGCHFSVHNNSPYECLNCHTESARGKNALLDAVAHVDSDFGIDYADNTLDVGYVVGNGVVSQHSITYTFNAGSGASPNMADDANNGCLKCHNVPGSAPGKLLAVNGSTFTPSAVGNRDDLTTYDAFCEGCHDGSLDVGEAFGNLKPPTVNKYFDIAGHGRTTAFDSGNTAPNVGCLECHLYHGSTAYKLLPGSVQSTDYDAATDPDSGARTIKGFSYTGSSATETTGTRYTIGGVPDSSHIDYIDYTVADRHNSTSDNKVRMAVKYADYDTTDAWDTYFDNVGNTTRPTDPTGLQIYFGTSGDRIDTQSRVACNEELNPPSSPAEPVGFCDTCHLYNDTTDGTDSTFGSMRTHAGLQTPQDCSGGTDYSTSVDFQKDCTECHDPHGSGYDGTTTDNDNSYMIKGKLLTSLDGSGPTIKTYNVVFKGTSGADSYDENDSDNKDDICAVCHNIDGTVGAEHNRTDNLGSRHNEGNDCTTCHFHSERFMPSGGCFECHPVGSDTMHKKHFNALGAALGYIAAGESLEDLDSFSPLEVCGNCHGDGAGSGPTHNQSGNQSQPWPVGYKAFVNIDDRSAPNSSWGDVPTYEGRPLPTTPQDGDTRCGDVDCHGNDDTTNDALLPPYQREGGQLPLFWNLHTIETDTVGSNAPNDGPLLSRVCQSCHDVTPADIRIFDKDGVLVYGKRTSGATTEYLSSAIDSAANYYGPVSLYGRGGHGDDRLSDPVVGLDRDTAVSDTPTDCSACHSGTEPTALPHVPLTGTNRDGNRLLTTNLEDGTHSTNGLCNNTNCHSSAEFRQSYQVPPPKTQWQHHPSYVDTIAPVTRIVTNVDGSTTWTIDAGNTYNQNAYGAALTIGTGDTEHIFPGNADRFVDWYNRGPTWTPADGQDNYVASSNRGVFLGEDGSNGSTDSPKAVLPLERYVLNNGISDMLLCVTCHNPHGTDLYIHDQHNVGHDIADHNMLRLQDDDNTLCNACH